MGTPSMSPCYAVVLVYRFRHVAVYHFSYVAVSVYHFWYHAMPCYRSGACWLAVALYSFRMPCRCALVNRCIDSAMLRYFVPLPVHCCAGEVCPGTHCAVSCELQYSLRWVVGVLLRSSSAFPGIRARCPRGRSIRTVPRP